MKTIKKVTALLLSMVLLFSFVVTQAFAFDSRYSQYLESDTYKIMYFHKDDEQIDSYARVTGDTWTAQDCNIGCRTYVTNYHLDSEWTSLFTMVAVVYVYSEYDNGMSGEETVYAKCLLNDELAIARATVGSSIDYEPESEDIECFASHHWLLEGYLRYNPAEDEFGDHFYQYSDDTLIIHSDPDYINVD